jgi:hypothetical protein
MPSAMKRIATLAAGLGLVACGGGNTKPTAPPADSKLMAPGDAKGVGQVGPAAKQPAPPDDPPLDPAEAARKAKVDEALTRIPEIKKALVDLRKLAFKSDTPALYQSTADFRKFVATEVGEELTPEKSAALAESYFHIGLLASPIDLVATLTDAFTSQAAAYYDPDQKKFFVVVVPDQALALDMFSSHELTHALQDQHFDLKQYLQPKTPIDDDQRTARNFVVEGEATLTMFAYAGQAGLGMGADAPKVDMLGQGLPLLKLALGTAAAMTLDDFKRQTKSQMGSADLDPEIAKSIEQMDAIPPVILVPMMDSYMKGAMAALAAYEAGGWDEVSKLYSNPPTSTEQVLHPTTKLYPTRDEPKQVTLPALPGITEVTSNVLGELSWRIYFMLWSKDAKKIEGYADGWDGDRFSVGKTADGTLVGVLVSTWDSAAEAKQFAKAYQASIKARFPKKQRKVWVKTVGETVYVVDGGKDAKLIDAVVKGTTIK